VLTRAAFGLDKLLSLLETKCKLATVNYRQDSPLYGASLPESSQRRFTRSTEEDTGLWKLCGATAQSWSY